ncbi:MAG: hypothetical protein WCF78_04390 [archaeon]
MKKRLVINIGRRGNKKIVSEREINKTKLNRDRIILSKDIKTKKTTDYYIYLKEKSGIQKLITRNGLKIIKTNPELMPFLKQHIFTKSSGRKVLETKNSKFVINDYSYPNGKSGAYHDKLYDLTYFDKKNNTTSYFFIKRALIEHLDVEDMAHSQFTASKLLEAAGFNIIKPQFGILDEINNISVIAYDYTNLKSLGFAHENKLITNIEYNKIKETLVKVEKFTENKFRITDIYNIGNVFIERTKYNKIKLYITDVQNYPKNRW